MDFKKVIIAVIILLILVVGAFFLFGSSGNQEFEYDDYFKITVPSDFETTESDGLITSAYPANKSYVVSMAEDNETTVDSIDSDFKTIQDASNITGFKEKYTDIKTYNLGNNKVYELTTTNESMLKEQGFDAKKSREVSFVVANSNKVYNLFFLTNDTSLDLHNSDIESIINSTSQSE